MLFSLRFTGLGAGRPSGDLSVVRAPRTELIFAFSWMQTPETGGGAWRQGFPASSQEPSSQGPLVRPSPWVWGFVVGSPCRYCLMTEDCCWGGSSVFTERASSSQRGSGPITRPAGGARPPAGSRSCLWCHVGPWLCPQRGLPEGWGRRESRDQKHGLTCPVPAPMFTECRPGHLAGTWLRAPPPPTPF